MDVHPVLATTQYAIINFRPSSAVRPSSSEYIRKVEPSKLVIHTRHGLGSGMYGLLLLNDAELAWEEQNISPGERVQLRSHYYTRESEIQSLYYIINPVIIDTNPKLDDFIKMSTWLINVCLAQVKQNKDKFLHLMKNFRQISEIQKKLCPLSQPFQKVITEWTKAYKNANYGDFIKQPINYLLQPEYDGIYNSCSDGNYFTVGSIKFIDLNPRDQRQNFLHGISPFLPDYAKLIGPSVHQTGGSIINRKAPKIGAKKFRLNTIKRGLDNNKWVCSKRRNGTKYWRKLDDLSHVKSK